MGIELFENKKSCCGCGACANICPKGAITMKPDKWDIPIQLSIRVVAFHVGHAKKCVLIKMAFHCMNRFVLMR